MGVMLDYQPLSLFANDIPFSPLSKVVIMRKPGSFPLSPVLWAGVAAAILLLVTACSQEKGTPEPTVPYPHAADPPGKQAMDLVGSNLPATVPPAAKKAPAASSGPGKPPMEKTTAAASGSPESGENEAGEKVFAGTCSACHGQGIAGAPKFGDSEAWKPRIAKGMDTLVKHAMEGFQGESGMMPAKGGNASLSEEDVEAAVRYMVEAAR